MSMELYTSINIDSIVEAAMRERERAEMQRLIEQQREEERRRLREATSLRESLERMRASMSGAVPGVVHTAKSEHFSNIFNYETNDITASGFSELSTGSISVSSGDGSRRELVSVDLSGLLDGFEPESDKGRKIEYVWDIQQRFESAAIVERDDVSMYNDFITYLNSLIVDDELDFDYFKALVEPRVASLESKLEFYDAETLYHYRALCSLLGLKPEKVRKSRMQAEIDRLTAALASRRNAEYVYNNLKEVFAELDMSIADEMELDGLAGHRVEDSGIADCAVFMSMDGEGIVFETVAETEEGGRLSADKKAKIEENANKVCEKHRMVIEKMRERGVELNIEAETKPKAERIRTVQRKAARKNVRNRVQERYIGG